MIRDEKEYSLTFSSRIKEKDCVNRSLYRNEMLSKTLCVHAIADCCCYWILRGKSHYEI